MIRFLELRNWRSHANTRLQFGKGTNLIVGIMGSGKSAVLDGICYTLYGTFPALKRRSVGMDDLLRHGEKEGHVRIEFAHDGKEYMVERKLRRGPRGIEVAAKIFEAGKLVESGQSRVSDAVEEVLGVDYDLFNRAIYSDQNNIGYFLDLDAGKRKKEMDGLMGLDKFEEVRANTVRVINRIEGEKKALEARYDKKRHEEITAVLEKKRKMISDATEEERKAEEDARAAARHAKEADERLLEMRKNKERKEAIGRALDRERGRVEALRSDVAGKDAEENKLPLMKKDLAEVENELYSVNEEIVKCEMTARMLAQEAGNLEERLREAELAARKREAAEKKVAAALAGLDKKAVEERLRDVEKELLELAADEKALLKGVAEIEAYAKIIKEKCPVCGTSLGKEMAAKIKRERVGEIDGKRRLAAAAHKRIVELEKEKDEIRKVLEEVREAEKWICTPKEGAGKISEILWATRKKCSEEEQKIAKFRALRTSLEKRREKAAAAIRDAVAGLEKKKVLASAESKVRELEKEFSSVIFNEREYAEAEKAVREQIVAKERAEGHLREIRKEVASLREMAFQLEKEKAAMDELKKEIRAREEEIAQLVLFKNAVVEAQAEMRAELIDAINSAMNGIWPVLYPYSDYRQLRITAGEDDYSFEIYDGEWRKLEKVGSGGEKACLALTLRIALATVLAPGAGWLILDEPTHNLDQEAVQALAEALESRVPELVKQAFVITHDESLMNSEFASSYRFKRDKGAAGATVAEGL